MVFTAHVKGFDHQVEIKVSNFDEFFHATDDDTMAVYPKSDTGESDPILLVQKKYIYNLNLVVE